MTRPVMVPVDLAHTGSLGKAVTEAGYLATARGTHLTLVGVVRAAATAIAPNPPEIDAKLKTFGGAVAARTGCPLHTLLRLETDLAVDLGPVLVTVAREIGADVIVMASDRPDATGPVTGATEEYVARHAGCSVFVVR